MNKHTLCDKTIRLVECFLDALDECEVQDLRLGLVDAAGNEHRWSLHLSGPEDLREQRLEEFISEVEMAAIRWGFQPDALAWHDTESPVEDVYLFNDFTPMTGDEMVA